VDAGPRPGGGHGARLCAQRFRAPRPLLVALDHGFNAVEPDVHLVQGRLLVGHDSTALRPERTLEAQHRLRFWGAPDLESIWRAQYLAGVDFINTDDLDGLRRFLERQR
jgi:hypothetical protein